MNIEEKLKNIEANIAENKPTVAQIVVHDKIVENDNNLPTTPQEMSEGQAKALLGVIKNPEDALRLKVSQNVVSKIESGAGKERLDKTTDKLVESGLATIETEADNKLSKAEKTAEEVFFERKKTQLNRGGIQKQTTQRIMDRVVRTDDVWTDINYFLFTWWVIGINNYFANMKNFHWFFKAIINVLFTVPMIALIPIEFGIGCLMCITHFSIIGVNKLINICKELHLKLKKKKEDELVAENNRETQGDIQITESEEDYGI